MAQTSKLKLTMSPELLGAPGERQAAPWSETHYLDLDEKACMKR